MVFKTRYANGAMLPEPSRLADAEHIRRNPETGEISWPPSDIEAQLIELGLIDNPNNRRGQ